MYRDNLQEFLHSNLDEEYNQYIAMWLADPDTIGEPMSFDEWLDQYENS